MPGHDEKVCGASNCNNDGKHLCGGCGETIYCSKECQKSDWSNHKLDCKSATKPEAAAMLQSFKGLSIKQLKNLVKAKSSSYGESKRRATIDRLDKIHEKEQLIKLVEEHVNPIEIEALLSGSLNPVVNGGTSSSGGAARKGKGMTREQAEMISNQNSNSQNPGTPSIAQVRQQASMMRKNPDAVRRADKMFAKMSDKEIFAYADQMEDAAKNPELFKEMMQMSQMPEKDRNDLKILQDGISGNTPRNEKWLQSVIKVIKKNPGVIKAMYKGKVDPKSGITEEQVEGFVDWVISLPDWVLLYAGKSINWGVMVWPKVVSTYNTVDDYMLGCAKYILMMIVFIILYYFMKIVWYFVMLFFGILKGGYNLIMGSGGASASKISSTGFNSVPAGGATTGTTLGKGRSSATANEDLEF